MAEEEKKEEQVQDAPETKEKTEEKAEKGAVDPSTNAQDDSSKDESEEKKEGAKEEAPKEEAPSEDVKQDADGTESEGEDASDLIAELSKDGKKVVELVEKMPVLEMNKLVKALEKHFGVSAAAVAVAAGGASGDGTEDKDEFTVELTSAGDSKIGVIKAVKATLGLGLKEAKELVESAPAVLKEEMKKEDAEELKKALEEGGATVTLK